MVSNLLKIFAALPFALMPLAGFADSSNPNGAQPWGMGLQPAATPVMEKITFFHNTILTSLIIAISVFVLSLILFVCWRFSEKRNPVPSLTTHNTALEILWVTVPALILVVIAFPSFTYLYYMDRTENADMTLKVTGYQWYWGYEYPDQDGLSFEALMIPEGEEVDTPRLLGTDNRVVVPSDTTVRVLVTAADVLHSWSMQPFGIKTDAIPGRNNETWFRVPADKEGIYYDQCAEICGNGHSYMPIMIEVVSKEKFAAWTVKAKEELALGNSVPNPASISVPVKLARSN